MAFDEITHPKLFVDQREPQLALFNGEHQKHDSWRNEAADSVLASG